jgi:hypothetical protein
MSYKNWYFEDIMLGVQSAQLSRKLPIHLKVLICNMSVGFSIYCVGARGAEFDKNGIRNRRDMKCLVMKYSSEAPTKEGWTCWPCLDFLKKHRTGLKATFNPPKKPQRFRTAHCSMKKNNVKISRKDRVQSEIVTNAAVIKLKLGGFEVCLDARNHPSPFLCESSGFKSNIIARNPNIRKCLRGI